MKDRAAQSLAVNFRFEAEPEAETRTAALCDEKHRTGSTRRCAAGGQTTGPGKRAVVSHVQTDSGDRSSPRVPRGNRSTPVNDRVASMKNLEDYLQPIQRRKTPVKLSESPLLSPDTAQALENAEKLVQRAEKQIIEASYDIASSPERENSIGSAKEKKADDDDDEVLHIRDVVSTKFHEANETARIFTRLSTRPLCDRLPKPEVRRSRPRRHGERLINIRPEVPTISRRKLSKNAGRSIEEIRSSFSPERVNRDKENSKKISIENPSILSVQRNSCKNANRNAIYLFKVQQGPRVDIRNDFTVTNVEKVDISPQPKSALPVKGNIKTYEFRHESCRNEEIGIGDRSMEIAGSARNSPEVTEKSRDKLRKSPEAAPAPSPQGSRTDLVVNKSGRSIRPERLEGLADNATTRISERNARESEQNEEIRGETNFIDFLRRSASADTRNFDEHKKNAEILKNRVIGSLNTNDKINIFDRAVDQFFDEFKRPDREIAEIGISVEHPKRKYKHFSPERDAIDGLSLEDLAGDERSVISSRNAFDDETEVFADNWDTDDINLEPPNFDDLEKTLRKFEGTVDKISRGARSLDVLISQYSSEAVGPERSVIGSADRGSRGENPTLFCSASIENQKIPNEVADFFDEKSAEKSALDSRREASPAAKIGKKVEKKLPAKLVDSHPRFSTPLNNGSRFENYDRSRDDLSSNEFARFFDGIQRPKVNPETRLTLPVRNETDFSAVDKRNELIPPLDIEIQKKIVLDEIDRNCNFDALFIRDRRSNAETEEKTRNTDILDTCDAPKKKVSSELREFESRSVIQDSAIGGTTDRSDEISFGTKLIDERSTRKDSSRSEKSAPAMRNDETSTKKSPSAEKLTVKNNSVETADMTKVEICDEKKASDRHDVDKEKSAKGHEASDKNRFGTSAESSPRDRTSFDVSTVYSDDFEEPIVTAEKSKSHEKLEETKNSVKKMVSNEKELPVTVDAKISDKNDKTLQSSSQKSIESSKLYGESKRDANYIEKSVSISVNKSSDKNQRDTKKSVSETKETVENNSVTKKTERNTREESDETSKDRNGATSSSASIKASDRSSQIGESQREVTKKSNRSNEAKTPDDCVDEKKCIACSCPLCEGIVSRCVCKECTNCLILEANESREKSNSIVDIRSVSDDYLENNEHYENEVIKTNCLDEEYANSRKHRAFVIDEYSSKNLKKSNGLQKENIENRQTGEKKKEKETSEQFEPIELSTVGNSRSNFCVDSHEANLKSLTDLEKIGKFDLSMIIHSTPKEYIESSTGSIDAVMFPFSDPIPNDDNTEGGTDTCSENYSEGEIYLPSSRSYSLGEIRIFERPGRGTVDTAIERVPRYNDGIRFFFNRNYVTFDSSDKAIDAPNTPTRSPGEVEETDAESMYSSRDLSSDAEHRQANKLTAHL